MKFVFFDWSVDNIGVQILTSVLKNSGYEVEVIYEPGDFDPFHIKNDHKNKIDEYVDEIIQRLPDAVGFSVYTHNYLLYRQVAEKIKQRNKNIVIVFGGIHTTLTKHRILEDDFVDFAIIGEGEEALVELLQEIENEQHYHKIKNLCFREDNHIVIQPCRPYLHDLDTLPIPDKSAYIAKNNFLKIRYQLTASRGCPFACTYCSNESLHKLYSFEKNHVRFRSPENVIAEIKDAVTCFDSKIIYFVDEVFTFDYKWLQQFAVLYKEIGLPIECITHPAYITPEKADLLKKLNTETVCIGIQTADEEIRKKVLNRYEANARITQSIRILQERGIKVAIDHIFALPGETYESIEYSIDSYSLWGPTYISMHWLAYYPGLGIGGIARGLGILSDNDIETIAKGRYLNNIQKLPAREQVRYKKYQNLMNCIGVLPGFLIRFGARNLELVWSNHLVSIIAQLFSRFIIHRKSWAFAYGLLLFKKKIFPRG